MDLLWIESNRGLANLEDAIGWRDSGADYAWGRFGSDRLAGWPHLLREGRARAGHLGSPRGGEEVQIVPRGRQMSFDVAENGIFIMDASAKPQATVEMFSFASRQIVPVARLPAGLRCSRLLLRRLARWTLDVVHPSRFVDERHRDAAGVSLGESATSVLNMHEKGDVPPVIRFGPFTLDGRSGELRNGPTRLKVPDQSIAVLQALLERPGELVTREALRDRLWAPDTFVDFEAGLNAAVRRLREALNDSADVPRYVETLPRRGYRFIAPVDGASTAPPAPAALVGAEAPTSARSETARAGRVRLRHVVLATLAPAPSARRCGPD